MVSYKVFLRAMAVVLIFAVVVFAIPAMASEGKPGKGDDAPPFSVTDLEGKKVVLADILKSGQVVFLNFWGLRCSACIDEIGYLNPLTKKFAGKGIVFLGVNVDGVGPDQINLHKGKMASQPEFTILPDPEFKIPDAYGLVGAPLSFLIGTDGKILWRHEGFNPGDEVGIEAELAKVAKKK